MTSPPRDRIRALRVLSLGDSYTIGESVAENEPWPVVLAEQLRAAGVAVSAPVIVARTGWTTDELEKAIDGARIDGGFDLVTLLIGVNNQYRNRPANEYRAGFRSLLARAVGFAYGDPRRAMVVSIPDWSVTPFADGRDRAAIAAEIDRFNDIARDETLDANARFVDITPISRRAADMPALLAADALHPSGAMYAEWVRHMLPVARAALGLA